jgi:hypothetical protein
VKAQTKINAICNPNYGNRMKSYGGSLNPERSPYAGSGVINPVRIDCRHGFFEGLFKHCSIITVM